MMGLFLREILALSELQSEVLTCAGALSAEQLRNVVACIKTLVQ
jgi:hypothetical protein